MPSLHRIPQPAPSESLARTAALFAAYSVSILLLILGIWWLSKEFGPLLFREGSPLEKFQLSLLLGTMGLNLLMARWPSFRSLMILLATLPALGAIRELDMFFDELISFGGWKIPFYGLLAAGLAFLWPRRKELVSQIQAFVMNRCFGIMWAGAMIAIPFAQMIGNGFLMKNVFGDDYSRHFKRLLEESCETMGYLLILIASVDWAIPLLRDTPRSGKQPDTAAS